jgi:hypothetical protein
METSIVGYDPEQKKPVYWNEDGGYWAYIPLTIRRNTVFHMAGELSAARALAKTKGLTEVTIKTEE